MFCSSAIQFFKSNVSLPFSTGIRHATLTDEGLIRYQFSWSMLVVESIENTIYIFIQTWSQTLEYEFIMQELEFFICYSSFINRNEITLYFFPVYIFLALFLSINRMNINSYRFGWLAVITTMMYRESNPNISSCCKECTNVQYAKHAQTFIT